MKLIEYKELKFYNTFRVSARARYFMEVSQEEDIPRLLEFVNRKQIPLLILSGGSNVLFTRDFEGVVALIRFRGIQTVMENGDISRITALAGTDWEELVDYAIRNQLSGIENLTLIPGQAGSSPIQNIGAYGVELDQVFYSLEAIDMTDGSRRIFYKPDCGFGYRKSIFKEERGRFLILRVTLELRKHFVPVIQYGDIRKYLERTGEGVTLAGVRDAIRMIRRSKLPQEGQAGSAGSFFKNPVVEATFFDKLCVDFHGLSGFPQSDGVKIPAAWLIEQCGWKGFRKGDAGVWPLQPLVLVNYGNASGDDIYTLARDIMASVRDRFGISLEPEVNIY